MARDDRHYRAKFWVDPQFVDPAHSAMARLGLLGITFLAIFAAGVALYALLAHELRGWFASPERQRERNRVFGAALMAMAASFAFPAAFE